MLIDGQKVLNCKDVSKNITIISTLSTIASVFVTVVTLWVSIGVDFEEKISKFDFWVIAIGLSVFIPAVTAPLFLSRLFITLQRLNLAQAALDRIANTDHLTGALNRHGFNAQAEAAIAVAQNNGWNVAALICDIDHFKRINDSFGHAAGDEAIRHVAMVIKSIVGEMPHFAFGRYGGEEFVILAINLTRQQIFELAETVRAACAASEIPIGDQQTSVTISIGTAISTHDDATQTDLLARADAALYRAKAKGRNRVEAAGIPMEIEQAA